MHFSESNLTLQDLPDLEDVDISEMQTIETPVSRVSDPWLNGPRAQSQFMSILDCDCQIN